jgi:hypothetical protein
LADRPFAAGLNIFSAMRRQGYGELVVRAQKMPLSCVPQRTDSKLWIEPQSPELGSVVLIALLGDTATRITIFTLHPDKERCVQAQF